MFAHLLNPIKTAVRKTRRNIADYGWSTTAQKSVSQLFKPIYQHRVYRMYRIDLSQAEFAPPPREDVQFRLISPDDEALIAQIEEMEEWLEGQMARRLTEGDLCLVAAGGDRIAGFNLITFGRVYIPLIEDFRMFGADEAWSEQISVSKDFRRKGIASAIRLRVFELLKSRGVKRLYGGALRTNVASLKLARRVGFEDVVDIHFTKVLNRRHRQENEVNQ